MVEKSYENLEICQKKLGQKPWTRGKPWGTWRNHGNLSENNFGKPGFNTSERWESNRTWMGSDGIYPTMRISPTTSVGIS
jgi:hypothetical protein